MADLVKKIKIKKQDGTFTDYIPIGAEAQNISTNDGESVQIKLNKKPYYYNNVADMKADTKLKVGDMAITLGYYEPNDGGAAEYNIINGEYTDDGGSYHLLENNLYAELIIKDTILLEQFGAYGDGIHNDAEAIQKVINIEPDVISGYHNNYLITSSIDLANKNVNLNVKITYNGNDYAFYATKKTYQKTIKIKSIAAANGGGFKINPTTDTSTGAQIGSESFSFCSIYIGDADCKLPVLYMDATYGVVTVINVDGIRWHSTNTACIYMNISSGGYDNSWLTEIDIHNVDLWGGTQRSIPGVLAIADGAGITEIEYNMFNVNIESCAGLHHRGKVLDIGLYGCRMIEICTVQGWLTFDGRLPNMTVIGTGSIRPQKIVYNNISSESLYLKTNMSIIDDTIQQNPSLVHKGGGIIGNNCFIPLNPTRFIKKIKDVDIIDDVYTYNFSNGEGYLTGFDLSSVSTRSELTLNIPYSYTANIFERPLILVASNPITTLTITGPNRGTKTISNFQYGVWEIIPYYNGFLVNKLS